MRVLLVEDNDGDAELVRGVFARAPDENLELTRVQRLEPAVKLLDEGRFDVVLLDLSLPDALGFEGLHRLRATAPSVPIVVLTSLLDPLAGARAIQHGAQDYLQKGVEGSEVLRALRYARERAQYAARTRMLADVGVAVSSSLDTRDMLAALVRTVTDGYADWCSVDGADGSEISVRDPSGPATAPTAPARIARLYAAFEGAPRAELDDARIDGMRGRGLSSAIIVPFCVGGWTDGLVTFARKPTAPAYAQVDVALAEDITLRLGSALTHAGLVVVAQRDRERAEVASRLRDEFLATLSHELRTPLNAILGWTQLLRAGKVGAENQPKALETIERNARSQVTLIEDVLDVSRIITGKLRINVSVVDLAELLGSALDSVRPGAEAKGIALELAPEATGTLQGDPDRLLQVMWNLLSNAVKFTPRGGTISIHVQKDGSCMEISVSDTGQGIDSDFLPYVFDRFRQADSTITRPHGGLGLGLAITRHLVEAQGGTIRVASDGLGRGATFTVRLPVSALQSHGGRAVARVAESGDEGGAIRSLSAESLAGLSILVVDDDADSRWLVQSLLEASDALVTTAASASQALSILTERPPDLLISDIGMPGETGYDLMRRVRAVPGRAGRTPAIALTAYASSESRANALLLGFDQYVTKPVEPSELLAVVVSLVRRFPGDASLRE